MTKKRAPRGYLLAEAAVAGAVLASAIAITFTLMAQGRTEVTYAAHRRTAAELGRTKADELASVGSCAALAATPGFVAVGSPYDAFKWKFSRGNAATTSTPAVPVGKLCNATVQITYPAQDGSQEDFTDGVKDHRAITKFTKMWSVP